MKDANRSIKTTGQLRTLLANCAQAVANGSMDLAQAEALNKLAENITESLYSEMKIAMFRHEIEQPVETCGELLLGEPD